MACHPRLEDTAAAAWTSIILFTHPSRTVIRSVLTSLPEAIYVYTSASDTEFIPLSLWYARGNDSAVCKSAGGLIDWGQSTQRSENKRNRLLHARRDGPTVDAENIWKSWLSLKPASLKALSWKRERGGVYSLPSDEHIFIILFKPFSSWSFQ